MSSLIDLRERAREIARGELGEHEVGGKNLGPRVEQYQRRAGLPPGQNWCCAFVYWCYSEAADELDILNPLPRTGRVSTMWALAQSHWKSHLPSLGAIYVHLNDPTDPNSDGHIGIVDAVLIGKTRGIEGNTNRKGSRVGDSVWEQVRPASYVLGYIDVGRLGPVLPRRLVS